MLRFVFKEEAEMTLDAASSRKEKHYRLVAVSFGLLCFLQAALNISLRLYSSGVSGAIIKNLTEEGEAMKRKLSTFNHNSQRGWVYFSHSFYHISSTEKSWQESRDDCQQRDGDLIIINSREEQEFARQFKRRTWIGLTDRDAEGRWTWVDGTELNTSYWYTGEPNGYKSKDEDCVEIRPYEEENNWNDSLCKMQKYWICEKKEATL